MREREQAIIIIGAARSGTKLLRRIIAMSPGLVEIPYDINYIWRLGNMAAADDALLADLATAEVAAEIRRYFATRSRSGRGTVVVEKTVGNSLRVPFVRQVFPQARLVHLVRDGRDVTASAMSQWQAPLQVHDVLKKLASFPFWRARRYAMAYVGSYVARAFRREPRIRRWGPVYPGMQQDVHDLPLVAICARQWCECVERARDDLARDPLGAASELRYEDLVKRPHEAVRRLYRELELDWPSHLDTYLQKNVHEGTVGSWRARLSKADLEVAMPILAPTLKKLDYSMED